MAALEVKDDRESGWFWASNALVDVFLARIGQAPFIVYAVLARHASSGNSRQAYPSYSKIMEEAKMGKSTVIRAVATLEKYNLIHVERRPSKTGDHASNLYTLLNVAEAARNLPLDDAVNDAVNDAGGSVTTGPPSVTTEPLPSVTTGPPSVTTGTRTRPILTRPKLTRDSTAADGSDPPKSFQAEQPKTGNAGQQFIDAFTTKKGKKPNLVAKHHGQLKRYRDGVGEAVYLEAMTGFFVSWLGSQSGFAVDTFIGKGVDFWLGAMDEFRDKNPSAVIVPAPVVSAVSVRKPASKSDAETYNPLTISGRFMIAARETLKARALDAGARGDA